MDSLAKHQHFFLALMFNASRTAKAAGIAGWADDGDDGALWQSAAGGGEVCGGGGGYAKK